MTFKASLLFVLLVCGTVCACGRPKKEKLLLLSVDGFRSDYLETYAPVKNFADFVQRGSRATIEPIFPTLTFPGHYTVVTGKYAENHGIVGNSMFDPVVNERFSMSSDGKDKLHWWNTNGTEPIWITAKRQGLAVGTYMWPGDSDYFRADLLPDVSVKFNFLDAALSLNQKFDLVLSWFVERSLDFVALYHPMLDSIAHNFGHNHTTINKTLHSVDESLGYLLRRLDELGLSETVNVVITSDHGMSNVRHHIVLEQLNISKADMNVVETGAYLSFNAARDKQEQVCDKLRRHPNLTVYVKEQIPERFRYKRHARIPDVLALADEGFAVAFKGSSDFKTLGIHGYDNELNSMQTVLFAKGPSFRVNYMATEAFKQVDLYSLLCCLLGIEPQPNDGRLDQIEEIIKVTRSPCCVGKLSQAASITSSSNFLLLLASLLILHLFSAL